MRKNFTFLFALFLVIAGTVRAEVAADLAGKYFSVADPTTTLQTDTWYLLKNQGRNAYISEQTTELRMKSAAELADVNDAEANAGLLFKFSNGTAEGMYNIVSGNGKYFTIANSSSAVSATAVDYIVGNVAEGVFYIQDPATSVVADGNAAGGTFVGWGTTVPTSAGGNSSYQFMEVDFIDAETAEAFVNATNILYDLQVTYGLVTDASKFSSNAPETTEGSFAALIDNDYGTFFHSAWSYAVEETHNLQMEVSEPTESIFFYFKKRSQNNNNRPTDITILGSNDGETFTEITNINSGFPTGASPVDYMSEVITASEAYKHFRFVVNATSTNTKFFTFSEFYLFPGNQAILDAIATSKALVEAGLGAENFDELKANFETAYNKVQEDKFNKLFNTAVAEAEALLAEAAHAEVPAVGQYPTAAYSAFESTIATLKAEATQENLDAINAAIAEFVQTKNLPVFTIDGVIDYAAGKSIYEDESGLLFKPTDLTDASMLWSFDMEGDSVGVTDAVVVRNLATGNLFWDAASIKVTETSENNAEDGIFLFYTEGNGTPIHAQNSGQKVVRWGSTEATSGSAWMFTYVGTTYDLYNISASAWTDVTAEYMTNADMSAETGWKLVGMTDNGPGQNYKFFGFYSGWGSIERTEGSIKQEVTLPAGEYRLTGKAFFRQGVAYNTDATKSLGYMVAGENKVLVHTLGSVEGLTSYANDFPGAHTALYEQDLYTNVLEFTLTEQTTLSIGYECTFDHIQSWFLTGSMKLERNVTPATKFMDQYAAFENLQNECTSMYILNAVMNRWSAIQDPAWNLKEAIVNGDKVLKSKVEASMADMAAFTAELKAIDEYYNNVFTPINDLCYEIQQNSTPNTEEAYAAFDEVCALAGFMNLYSNVSTLEDLQVLADTLEDARRVYVVNAVPAEGFSFDYTFLVEGVGNSTDGWVRAFEGFSHNYQYQNADNKNTDTLKKRGYIEAWNNGVNFTGTLTYEAALPNGYYRISAYAFTDGATSFVADSTSVAVEKTGMYVQPVIDSVLVTDGTMNFGLNIEGATWVGITNIELAYLAAVPADILLPALKETFLSTYNTLELQNEKAMSMYMIGQTHWSPVQNAAWEIKDTLDNVTDVALLESMIAEMQKTIDYVDAAWAVYSGPYTEAFDMACNAADNTTHANDSLTTAFNETLNACGMMGVMMASSIEAIEALVEDLTKAYAEYAAEAVVNEGAKLDVSFFITNPSFETGDLTGWEANQASDTGVKPNSNGTYTMEGCDGDYVFNTWYGTGIYVQQTVKDLPAGTYALNVVVASDANILLDIAAGTKTIQHTCQGGKGVGNVVVVDSVAHEGGDLLIKVATVNNDWFKADDFQLYRLGEAGTVVTPELNPIAVAPESGKELETLTELLLAYDAEVMVSEDCEETIKVTDVNGVVVAEATAENCMVDENEVTVTFAEAIVVNGTYTVTVPAGMFLLDFEFESAAIELTYTIVNGIANIEAADDAVIYTITGKRIQGNVKSLERGTYIVNGKKVLVK